MAELLSLPPELLLEIIQTCPKRERCSLRATCKSMNELADPIVFRRICLSMWYPHMTEHQITTLVTWPSKACEFVKEMMIPSLLFRPQASEQSWPHFGPCNDLRVHIPTTISKFKNLTRFRWCISDHDQNWLVNSLLHAVARLPGLTELDIRWDECEARIPVGIFSNLSKLSVSCGQHGQGDHLSFISQTATAIGNSPYLKSLDVCYLRFPPIGVPLPTLSDLFAKVPMKNPLFLEHLSIKFMDATVNQATLPHLMHLTSFEFLDSDKDLTIARNVWTSLQVNNIELSDVVDQSVMTEEMMLYLSSFSGLKRLVVNDLGDMESMLLAEVLPKHVNTLQTLKLHRLIFDHSKVKLIMNYQKLRDLMVRIDGKGITVQFLLDTVAGLPELKILSVLINNAPPGWEPGPANFEPNLGLRYVDELEVQAMEALSFSRRRYELRKDGEQPVEYREIPWFNDF